MTKMYTPHFVVVAPVLQFLVAGVDANGLGNMNVAGPAGGTEGISVMLDVPCGMIGADEMIAIDFLVGFPSGKTLFVVESALVEWVGFVGFAIPHHDRQSLVG
eukprot:5644070-Ditylum_brightwellii.AAC.1